MLQLAEETVSSYMKDNNFLLCPQAFAFVIFKGTSKYVEKEPALIAPRLLTRYRFIKLLHTTSLSAYQGFR